MSSAGFTLSPSIMASDDVSMCVRKSGPIMLLPNVGLNADTKKLRFAERHTGAAGESLIVIIFAPFSFAMATASLTSTV